MRHNVGTLDRMIRVFGAIAFSICAALAPLSPVIRGGVLGLSAVYLLFSALAGTCFGYSLLGKSTCPLQAKR
jgi:hypothetical protein